MVSAVGKPAVLHRFIEDEGNAIDRAGQRRLALWRELVDLRVGQEHEQIECVGCARHGAQTHPWLIRVRGEVKRVGAHRLHELVDALQTRLAFDGRPVGTSQGSHHALDGRVGDQGRGDAGTILAGLLFPIQSLIAGIWSRRRLSTAPQRVERPCRNGCCCAVACARLAMRSMWACASSSRTSILPSMAWRHGDPSGRMKSALRFLPESPTSPWAGPRATPPDRVCLTVNEILGITRWHRRAFSVGLFLRSC